MEEQVITLNENATIDVIADADSPVGYSIVDNGTVLHCTKLVPYKGRVMVEMPENSTLRKWTDKTRLDAAIAKDGKLTLGYKARVTLGAGGTHYPQEKLISYLSEEEQAEYKAIVDRARQAMADAKAAERAARKKEPVSALDKARKALERAQAKLAALEASENN